MKIAIGADHAGFDLKEKVRKRLEQQGHQVVDEGTLNTDSVDYPDFAAKVAHDVAEKRVDKGVLVCGSGIGMAISANKVAGVRAASINSVEEVKVSREHNDLNVLAIGSRFTPEPKAYEIVETFLNTQFAGGRHAQRVSKIAEIEKQESVQAAKR
jgi:ribose 5-phosphate isomerase B